jgi:hypothetical protein
LRFAETGQGEGPRQRSRIRVANEYERILSQFLAEGLGNGFAWIGAATDIGLALQQVCYPPKLYFEEPPELQLLVGFALDLRDGLVDDEGPERAPVVLCRDRCAPVASAKLYGQLSVCSLQGTLRMPCPRV